MGMAIAAGVDVATVTDMAMVVTGTATAGMDMVLAQVTDMVHIPVTVEDVLATVVDAQDMVAVGRATDMVADALAMAGLHMDLAARPMVDTLAAITVAQAAASMVEAAVDFTAVVVEASMVEAAAMAVAVTGNRKMQNRKGMGFGSSLFLCP